MIIFKKEMLTSDLQDIYPHLRGDFATMLDLDELGFINTLSEFKKKGPAYSLYLDEFREYPIAIVGLLKEAQLVWVAGTELINQYPKVFTEALRTMQDQEMQKLGIDTVYSEVLLNKPTWIRWAEHAMGWEKEYIVDDQFMLMSYSQKGTS